MMQGLRMDFSNYLPPKIAQRLLGQILSDSVSILSVRYSSARPCLKRVPQVELTLIQSHELLEFLDFDTHTFGKQKASTQKAVFSEKNIYNSGFAKVSMSSRMRTPNPAVPC